MKNFSYKAGILNVENVDLDYIASEIDTPFYCYSVKSFEESYRSFSESLKGLDNIICFSVKSNSNIAILKLLTNMGAGCDVVSEGELHRALISGVKPEKIVFSGVGKTERELKLAIQKQIGQINVESVEELKVLNQIAEKNNKIAPIALRINPDVDPKTHEKVSTGRKEDKFGIALTYAQEIYKLAHSMQGINLKGLAIHIGSQITNLGPYEKAFRKIRELTLNLENIGLNVKTIDVGGGIGVNYSSKTNNQIEMTQYAKLLSENFGDLGCKLYLEPGRAISAHSGILVTKVIYIKKGSQKDFIILDSGMNDLMRPALYNSEHEIITVKEPQKNTDSIKADVVGPICETGDRFLLNKKLPKIDRNDLLAFTSTGAYGAVMSSQYNSRPLIPEVLVSMNRFSVIRRRPTMDEILSLEEYPEWLVKD